MILIDEIRHFQEEIEACDNECSLDSLAESIADWHRKHRGHSGWGPEVNCAWSILVATGERKRKVLGTGGGVKSLVNPDVAKQAAVDGWIEKYGHDEVKRCMYSAGADSVSGLTREQYKTIQGLLSAGE